MAHALSRKSVADTMKKVLGQKNTSRMDSGMKGGADEARRKMIDKMIGKESK